jgi:hypothetical protein
MDNNNWHCTWRPLCSVCVHLEHKPPNIFTRAKTLREKLYVFQFNKLFPKILISTLSKRGLYALSSRNSRNVELIFSKFCTGYPCLSVPTCFLLYRSEYNELAFTNWNLLKTRTLTQFLMLCHLYIVYTAKPYVFCLYMNRHSFRKSVVR